ncbi:MAG: flagellar motor stator protein MotA [Nitrospinae bacterium]|nr:flagellar motor stator protein MotA [Nitrospinota bacterium]
MPVLIGCLVVIVGIISGYLLEKGNLHILFQPAEVLIIGGGALGGLIIASSPKTFKAIVASLKVMVTRKPYGKEDYMEVLMLLNAIFTKIRREGLKSLEREMDKPFESELFKPFPRFLKNHHAIHLLSDTFRMIFTTKLKPHQLEALWDAEIETQFENLMLPSKKLGNMADSLPGLGIVAAVLGVVITMQKINSPPEVIGHSVGAALVGTFLGVLMCYGFVGPMSQNLESIALQEKEYLNVLKGIVIPFVAGVHPNISIEFGRLLIPEEERPSFLEVEDAILKAKRASGHHD